MDPEVIQLRQQVKELQQQVVELQSASNRTKKITHSVDTWTYIRTNCTKATVSDSIKSKIKEKTMTVYDTDYRDQTLLIHAATNGAYDLVKFLLNNVEHSISFV